MSVIKPVLQHPELITYLSGANNYSWVHFRNGEKKLLAKPISYLERELPSFIRVHKTTLLNPAYVKSLHRPPRQKMSGEIHLLDGAVFPVSRRRWEQVEEAMAERLSATEELVLTQASPTETKPVNGPVVDAPTLSILMVSDDDQNADLAFQTLEKKWPAYHFHSTGQGTHLPELLAQLPQAERPILVLLDARTATLERFHTLQRLKQQPQLRRIPVVMLVSPTDKLVIDGYTRQANSVISLKEGYLPFVQAVERICRFWFRTAALPNSATTPAD